MVLVGRSFTNKSKGVFILSYIQLRNYMKPCPNQYGDLFLSLGPIPQWHFEDGVYGHLCVFPHDWLEQLIGERIGKTRRVLF